MPTVVDVIQNTLNDKPADAKEALDQVMLDKIRERLEAKRQEMAQLFYGDQQDQQDGEPDESDAEDVSDEEDEEFEDEDEESDDTEAEDEDEDA